MGTSTNAYLMYGYDLGNSDEWKIQGLGEYGEWEPEWLEDDDLPTSAEKALLASVGFTEEWSKENEGYFGRRQVVQDQIAVTIESHCSAEYPMYVLSAKMIRATRGNPKVVDPDYLQRAAITEDLNVKLTRACTVLGIQPIQTEPLWLLCSDWG
jgi:hypothetical protein